jgi:hypothetical protein
MAIVDVSDCSVGGVFAPTRRSCSGGSRLRCVDRVASLRVDRTRLLEAMVARSVGDYLKSPIGYDGVMVDAKGIQDTYALRPLLAVY